MAETKGKFRVGDYVELADRYSIEKFDTEGDILIRWVDNCMGTAWNVALRVLKNFCYRYKGDLPYRYEGDTPIYEPNYFIVRGYIMVDSEYRYIIENADSSRVYITLESNLEYRAKRMTKAEIEAELGYKIEIVEDKEN